MCVWDCVGWILKNNINRKFYWGVIELKLEYFIILINFWFKGLILDYCIWIGIGILRNVLCKFIVSKKNYYYIEFVMLLGEWVLC